jgi:alkaline phosphatase
MKRFAAKLAAVGMAALMISSGTAGCGSVKEANAAVLTQVSDKQTQTTGSGQSAVPKYVFLFIGDGMSYPQIESTNYYLSALEKGSSMGNKEEGSILSKDKDALPFMNFPVIGSAQTYDSTSFCPDSASTATAISTGHKTYSGTINMDETGTKKYETITEKLKDQLGYKIGVISSVNLNHATPAAFYCHQPSRSEYYEIGKELIESDFDYFAGGGLLKPTGEDKNQADLYELADKAGYTVVKSQEEADKVTAKTGKTILIDEHLADEDAMAYEIDRKEGQWALSDYVEKGIDCLYEGNDKGFFMMVEGGKIDWACHANDAATTMADTRALSDSVDEAIAFYEEHPKETLILVTGDHETGGLTIGYAGTNYDTFLQNLDNQKISFKAFDDNYVKSYKEEKTSFEAVMQDITELFGLIPESATSEAAEDGVAADSADQHPTGVTSGNLVLTDYELNKLKAAYAKTMAGSSEEELSQEEYVLYGSYEPLTVTITHILNNKSGISFSSYSHTGLPVAVCAMGNGENKFAGFYDNTEVYGKMAEVLGVK